MNGPSAAKRAGFTLLELLVVIALMAIALGVVSIGVGQGLRAAKDRQVLAEMVSALRETRTLAVISGAPALLQFDLPGRSFRAPGRKLQTWPTDMAVRLTTAEQLGASVMFFPDGSSSGGNLLIERASRHWRIDIGWLTGSVRWQVLP